jgi:DNA-binding NarL/FixJ family response regulator
MDLRLPGTNGTDTLITIRGEYPEARIFMLTTSHGDGDIYILKSRPKKELLDVLRLAYAGRPPEVAARLGDRAQIFARTYAACQ